MVGPVAGGESACRVWVAGELDNGEEDFGAQGERRGGERGAGFRGTVMCDKTTVLKRRRGVRVR